MPAFSYTVEDLGRLFSSIIYRPGGSWVSDQGTGAEGKKDTFCPLSRFEPSASWFRVRVIETQQGVGFSDQVTRKGRGLRESRTRFIVWIRTLSFSIPSSSYWTLGQPHITLFCIYASQSACLSTSQSCVYSLWNGQHFSPFFVFSKDRYAHTCICTHTTNNNNKV